MAHIKITDSGMKDNPENIEGQYYPDQRRIDVNPRVFDKGSESLGIEKNGWYSKSGHKTSLDRTLDHEFGHHLDYNLSPQERNALFTHLTGVIGKTKYVTMPTPNQVHFVKDNKAEIVNNVGTYAATNDRELVAELWAEYHGKKLGGVHPNTQYKSSQLVGRYFAGHDTPYNPEEA